METAKTPKDFVLLCIDNEIYRYEEKKGIETGTTIATIDYAISVLQEFRQNIEYNL